MRPSKGAIIVPYRPLCELAKFSGKELDDITGSYDHGARNRNPITAVWYGIDELFEKYPENGPYNYCGGNPVRYFDPDGKEKHILYGEKDVIRIKQSNNYLDNVKFINIYTHGSIIGIKNFKENKVYTNPDEFRDYLERNSLLWQSRRRSEIENSINDQVEVDAEIIVIQFYSCDAGSGDNSFAQRISAAKGFENVLIIAADENVNMRTVNDGIKINVLKNDKKRAEERTPGNWRFFLNGKEVLKKKCEFDKPLKFNLKELPLNIYKGLVPLSTTNKIKPKENEPILP